MLARQAAKGGQTLYFLYCSEECAEGEEDAQVAYQPAFAVAAMLAVPAYEGRHCRICGKKLQGPRLAPTLTSAIPVAAEPHRLRAKAKPKP